MEGTLATSPFSQGCVNQKYEIRWDNICEGTCKVNTSKISFLLVNDASLYKGLKVCIIISFRITWFLTLSSVHSPEVTFSPLPTSVFWQLRQHFLIPSVAPFYFSWVLKVHWQCFPYQKFLNFHVYSWISSGRLELRYNRWVGSLCFKSSEGSQQCSFSNVKIILFSGRTIRSKIELNSCAFISCYYTVYSNQWFLSFLLFILIYFQKLLNVLTFFSLVTLNF